VLLIADEVMCGSGRTGTWLALEQDGVMPDILAIAKGLAGGYLPLGATVYSHAIASVLEAADGGPLTGHTFSGHTAACAAGVAVRTAQAAAPMIEQAARPIRTPARARRLTSRNGGQGWPRCPDITGNSK
jgi:hypothetical protein